MKRFSRPLLSLVGAAVLVTALATTTTAESLFVEPGQAIGGFRLDQDLNYIVSSLGPLYSQDDVPDSTLTGYYWPLRRIGVIADRANNKVVAVAVSLDDRYKTDKGIIVGSEMAAVRRAYGPEDAIAEQNDVQTLVYNRLGIAFVVNRDGPLGNRVSVIFIFAPGRFHDVFSGHRHAL